MEGTINFTNPKELYYQFDILDFYYHDTLDKAPNLIVLILIAYLPCIIGSLFIIIYLKFSNHFDPSTDIYGHRI